MSDLQDLIHKTSIDCIEKGKRIEQERIILLLNMNDVYNRVFVTDELIALIKGETE